MRENKGGLVGKKMKRSLSGSNHNQENNVVWVSYF